MFIQTEKTPNPDTLKFIPDSDIGIEVKKLYDITKSDETMVEISPLAKIIFTIPEIERVFITPDFISVTKNEDSDWGEIRFQVIQAVMEHSLSCEPAVIENDKEPVQPKDEKQYSDIDKAIINQIKTILDEYIRPAVAMDGGDITFDDFKNGIVYVHMRGACAGCPASGATLKAGIETTLKKHVPEVKEVRQALQVFR